jgi:FG-GAP-like repeat
MSLARARPVAPRESGRRQYVAVANLDGDDALDLVTANFDTDDVSVLLGAGDGTFGAGQTFAVDGGPRAVAIGDLDGDGPRDLVTANLGSGDVSVLINRR